MWTNFPSLQKSNFWGENLQTLIFFLSDWLFCDCDWPDGPTTFLEFGKTLTWITRRGQVNVKSLVFLSGQANKNSSKIILMTWTESCNCGVVYSCMHEPCVGTLVIIYNNFYSCWEVRISNYHFQIGVLQIICLHTPFTGFIQFKYNPKLRQKFSCFPGICTLRGFVSFKRKINRYTQGFLRRGA